MRRSRPFGVICLMLGALSCQAACEPSPPKPQPAPVTDTLTKPAQAPTSAESVSETVDGPVYRAADQVPVTSKYERVFSVPDGPAGLWINRHPIGGDEPNGPQGCAVDDDGSFWFIDSGDGVGMSTRFVHYSPNGKRLGVHPTKEHQLEGLLAMGGHLYARDLVQTAFFRFSLQGMLEQKLVYARVLGFARLGDRVAAIRHFYPMPLPNADRDLSPSTETAEFSHRGVRYELAEDSIQVGKLRTRIEQTDTVLSRGLLGLTDNGDLLTLMHNEEGAHTVLRFDATGKLTGQAWVPHESVLIVPHPLCVGPTGDVFATITREKRIDLVKLAFAPAVL